MDQFGPVDAGLVLVGHGSTLNAESSAPAHQHADNLRGRKLFTEVVTCFWKEEPSIAAVLRGVRASTVFVVPLFISEGYFTEEVIPRELGFAPDLGGTPFPRKAVIANRVVHYCAPVGTHPGMTEALLERARAVVRENPFPRPPKASETALFIAGHGTGNNENSRKAIEAQVKLLNERGIYREVQAIFMEEEPRINQCYALSRASYFVVVPFFISDGLHSYEDIPVMLGAPERTVKLRLRAGQPTWRNPTEQKRRLVWYAPSIGSEPFVAEVVLERVREAIALEDKEARLRLES